MTRRKTAREAGMMTLFAPPWKPKDALISPDGLYRYTLERKWGPGGDYVNFCMLNPSTADAADDDNTIKRCTRFAQDWGYSGLIVTNLFALRSTDPRALDVHPEPVGPENDEWLRLVGRHASLVVCAWGADRAIGGRAGQVRRLLSAERLVLHHLGLTKDGHPKHPLFLPGRLTPQPWEAPSP